MAQAMTDAFEKLKNESLKYGLIVNEDKIKKHEIYQETRSANSYEY
jgi:hypothetical protein